MTAKSTKGTKVCMVKSSAVGTVVVISAATKAKPAVVTVADGTVFKVGDIVKFASDTSGLANLDGKSWVITAISTNDLTLGGSDTTNDTGTFTAGVGMTHYTATDMECLCWSSISFNPEAPETISVGTFCNPNATLAGESAAGTVDFGGYVDVSDTEYQALLDAANGSSQHTFRLALPNNGYLVWSGEVTNFNWTVPLSGAVSYSGSVVLHEKVKHVF